MTADSEDYFSNPGQLRRHSIGEIFFNVSTRLSRLLRAGVIAALWVHIGFVALFWTLEIWVLVAFNLFSVALYGLCLTLMRRGRLPMLVLLLAGLEIMAHATLASWVLGWNSGFHYYVLAMVPLIFVDPRAHPVIKIIGTVGLIILYVGLDVLSHAATTIQPLNESVESWLRYFNATACLTIFATLLNVQAQSMRRSESRLRTLADTDNLTGLRNRRSLINLVRQRYPEKPDLPETAALVLIDVDHFKTINDHYGHACGDEVLKQLAATLRAHTRAQDSVARWGGEEFLLLLHEANQELAWTVAERIRKAVAEMPLEEDGESFSITITAGIAVWQPGDSLDRCIAQADNALYQGKAAGRDQSVTANRPI